eukprot:Pompholyxophrys_punicea_v1_NODE_9_length_7618_cov_25.552288.p7 type:complete len:113 gc:universal NODE_9_length_7618_cov_25.552288:6402-6064(-)
MWRRRWVIKAFVPVQICNVGGSNSPPLTLNLSKSFLGELYSGSYCSYWLTFCRKVFHVTLSLLAGMFNSTMHELAFLNVMGEKENGGDNTSRCKKKMERSRLHSHALKCARG